MILRPPGSTRTSTLLPSTTLCRSATAAEAGLRRLALDEPVERLNSGLRALAGAISGRRSGHTPAVDVVSLADDGAVEVLLSSPLQAAPSLLDRKSTRLNSSH